MNKRVLLTALALTVMTGCGSVARIGQVGTHEIFWVQTCDTVSPCTTTILTHNLKDGAVNKIEGGTGPSVLGQILGPASVATAGYFIGSGISDSGDKITETNNVNSKSEGSTSGSTGGDAYADGGQGFSNSYAEGGAAVANASARAGVVNHQSQNLGVHMNQNTNVGIGIVR